MIRTKALRALTQSKLPPEPLALAGEIGKLTAELDEAIAQLDTVNRCLDKIRRTLGQDPNERK